MNEYITQYEDSLVNIGDIDFNTHTVFDKIGRNKSMTVMTIYILNKLGLDKVQ